jgi:iron complex outermembrane receptor protein
MSSYPYWHAFVCLFLAGGCWAQSADLTDLSLDDLAKVQVTSASRKAESLSTAPAAIYVLTSDAIRDGGFTTLPEALRMVPGLYVAQTDDHIWQISARGFSDLYNDKMLVLVDGRSVYTPLYGGVYWDALDIPLENIDRVEVIRGPGGTLWGADAMNGVINIVTKSADQIQGSMVSATLDKDTGYTTTVRQGGAIGSKLNYYVYGRASYLEPFASRTNGYLPNSLTLPQAGLRVDWAATAKDTLTVEGGGYDGRILSAPYLSTTPMQFVTDDYNAQVRWKRTFSDRSSLDTLAYCDWYNREQFPADGRTTCDVETQHDFEINARNSLIWGAAFNTTKDDLPQDSFFISPVSRRNSVASVFAQYGFVIVPDRLRIIAGSKFEHNGYTGFDYQPQARAVWTPSKSHAFWTSVSRAVRVPSRGERDVTIDQGFPGIGPGGASVVIDIDGSDTLRTETLIAYETGYRFQQKSFSVDVATYYNQYDRLINTQQTISFIPGELLTSYLYVNQGGAQTHGAEISAQWHPIRRWTLAGGVTETRGSPNALQATPKHLFNLQSQLNLTKQIDFHTSLYHYSEVPLGRIASYVVVPFQSVPEFDRLDVGGDWHLRPEWTLGVWGQNLQSPRHVETRNTLFRDGSGLVPRSVVFKLMWQSKPEKSGTK